MPGPLSPTFVYEIRARMAAPTIYNQEVSMVRNYLFIPGTGVGLTIVDAMATFKASFRAAILPILSDQQLVARYEVRSIYTRTALVPAPAPPRPPNKLAYLEFYAEEGLAGTDKGGRATVQLLPPTDSVSVESRTFAAGRAAFGMSRLGFVPTVDVDEGNLTGAAQVIWKAASDWYKATLAIGVGGDTMEPVIFNKRKFLTAIALNPPATYCDPITQTNLAKTLGTQLTRKRPIRRPGY